MVYRHKTTKEQLSAHISQPCSCTALCCCWQELQGREWMNVNLYCNTWLKSQMTVDWLSLMPFFASFSETDLSWPYSDLIMGGNNACHLFRTSSKSSPLKSWLRCSRWRARLGVIVRNYRFNLTKTSVPACRGRWFNLPADICSKISTSGSHS